MIDGTEYGGVGIISACAERTDAVNEAVNAWRDHLRVCGAD